MNPEAAPPDHLDVGPLRLTLHPGPEGPLATLDGALQSFCAILMFASKDEGAGGLYEATQSGATWNHAIVQVRPVEPGDDLEAAGAVWKRLTGRDLEGELRLMFVGGNDTDIVPLDVLRDGARELRKLRKAHAIPPPWLFTVDPKWPQPHISEVKMLTALERRCGEPGGVEAGELRAAGLDSEVRGREKVRALLGWDLQKLALRYIDLLGDRAPGLLPPPPWLFIPEPAGEQPHPAERDPLVSLDREAAAIDDEERALDGAPDPPELLRRRSEFLKKLRDHGLLDDAGRSDKLNWLHGWRLLALLARYEAALEGIRYLRSDERSRYNPDAGESGFLEAPVCLDIFRGLRVPDGVSRFSWISWGEYLLRKHGPARDVRADQGMFPYHDQDGLIHVVWRRDAGIPALRYLSLKAPPAGTA